MAVVDLAVLQCLLNYGFGYSDDTLVQIVVRLLVKTILRYAMHCFNDHLLEDLREKRLLCPGKELRDLSLHILYLFDLVKHDHEENVCLVLRR